MIPYICIFVAHSTAYSELAEITETNKAAYAKRHGHDFRSLTMPVGQHFSYEMIQHVLNLMKLGIYEWIYWSGTDSMITNFNIKLEEIIGPKPVPDFIVAYDAHGLQSDSFLIRTTPPAMDYFQSVVDTRAEYIVKPFAEQGALEELMTPELNVRKVPQRTMNSFDYAHYHDLGGNYAIAKDVFGNDGQWQPGDFLIHWPAIPTHVRIELAKQMEGQVQK